MVKIKSILPSDFRATKFFRVNRGANIRASAKMMKLMLTGKFKQAEALRVKELDTTGDMIQHHTQ